MKKSTVTKCILAALVIACALVCFAACDNNPPVQNGGYSGTTLAMMVASYDNNIEVDGKLAVNAANEYAFILAGDEIKNDNIKVFTNVNDISTEVGKIVKITVDNDTITAIDYIKDTLTDKLATFEHKDGKVYNLKGEEIKISAELANSPETNYFAFDGLHVLAGNGIFSSDMGVGSYTDDVIEFIDVDADGTYDYAKYTPIYNALKVVSVKGKEITLSGGFGSAVTLGIFDTVSPVTVSFKKSLSTKVPEVGTFINATLKLDATNEELLRNYKNLPIEIQIKGEADEQTYPISFIKTEDDGTMLVKLNGSFVKWSGAAKAQDDGDSGKMLMTEQNLNKAYKFITDERGYIVYAERASATDVEIEKLIGATSFETENGTTVAGVLDVQGWWHRIYSYKTLSGYVMQLKNMGLRRIYVVTSNPGYPMFAAAITGYSSRRGYDAALSYFKNMGFEYPDFAIADACHKNGMECYAVYKPYEGGGGVSTPLGAEVGWGCVAYEDMFGQRYSFDNFIESTLAQGKDYRVCRRPDGVNDELDGDITKITVDILVDGFTDRSNYQRREQTTVRSAYSADIINGMADGRTYSNTSHHRTYGINVWVSDDNGTYDILESNYSYKYTVNTKVLYDAEGDEMFDGVAKKVVTLEVTGLAIKNRFVAVTFDNGVYNRLNLHSMVHIYSGNREIPSSKARYVRTVYEEYDLGENYKDYVWGCEPECVKSERATGIMYRDGKIVASSSQSNKEYADKIVQFNKYGFEFNWYPFGECIDYTNSIIGIARGKSPTYPGGLCEGYEEVRSFWLSHVESLAKGGFDGIVIRPQSHSSMVPDYKNYGFNEPIMEKYKELYGENAYNTLMNKDHAVTDEEALRIMEIRGDYFELFLDDAAELCHDYGIEFSVTLRQSYCDPEASNYMNEVAHWTMPKIILDWKHCVEISDFVVIKDYLYASTEVAKNAVEIRKYAHELGKKVWIECYDDQASMLTSPFINAAIAQTDIDGIIVYELTKIDNYAGTLKPLLEQCGFKHVDKSDNIKVK